MHYRFIRDSFFGRFAYHISGHKLFTHAEEQLDYVIPKKYLEEYAAAIELAQELPDKEKLNDNEASSSVSLSDALPVDTNIYAEWDGPDDPENPVNWPIWQKSFFIFEIAFLTTVVYMGSAIYTPGIEELQEEFKISQTLATLPLTMFVLGYALGPMVFSPMSENAALGRTSIYVLTMFVFFILQIPTALSKNIASLCVLRFISGFFASPSVATAGASAVDVMGMAYAPVGIAVWCIGGCCGPSLGPFLGAILTVKGGWRWTFWFMAIVNGASVLFFALFLPESYGKTLLLRKAKRLRAITGNQRITTPEEVENRSMTFSKVAYETLWKPIEISLYEPVVILINIYISLVYSIMYLWFEAFPLVFLGTYNFTLIEMGVGYLAIIIGILVGAAVFLVWVHRTFTMKVLAGEALYAEVFIPGTIGGSICMPIGVLLFGWTAAADIHWVLPLIGAGIFAASYFVIFQTLFNYLGMSFPRYAASAFASNALIRSIVGALFPLFGHALFYNLRTPRFVSGWGCTILGLLAIGMISIPVLFYLNGPKLRARSKFAN